VLASSSSQRAIGTPNWMILNPAVDRYKSSATPHEY